VSELEREVENLTRKLAAFREWFFEYDWQGVGSRARTRYRGGQARQIRDSAVLEENNRGNTKEQAWDQELEQDIAAGKLEKLAAEVLEEQKGGKTKEI